ncbi:MAG: hypothetical protein WCE61_04080 [Candidatus Acidiferrum sp.]
MSACAQKTDDKWGEAAIVTLGVYSHVAKEDDMRIAAQLGEILDPSGPLHKGKRVAVSQQPFMN